MQFKDFVKSREVFSYWTQQRDNSDEYYSVYVDENDYRFPPNNLKDYTPLYDLSEWSK